jgi:transcriptional regulator with XRE-family HTH domain
LDVLYNFAIPFPGPRKTTFTSSDRTISMPRANKKAIDVYVGERVRRLRMQHGLSEEKLADRLGVTLEQVQTYEQGANPIGPDCLAQIAEIFSVTSSYFFVGAPRVFGLASEAQATISAAHVTIAKFVRSDDGQALASAFERISDGTLRRVPTDHNLLVGEVVVQHREKDSETAEPSAMRISGLGIALIASLGLWVVLGVAVWGALSAWHHGL